jgi:hypothetical protein
MANNSKSKSKKISKTKKLRKSKKILMKGGTIEDEITDDDMNVLRQIINIIDSKIKSKDLNITHDIYPNNTNIFQIISENNISICTVDTNITEKVIIDKETEKETLMPVFNINWVFTDDIYKANGFATMLLIYSICYLKYEYKDIQYVLLYDVTSRNTSRANLYNKIGFERIYIEGLEQVVIKQLLINKRFIRLALDALKIKL